MNYSLAIYHSFMTEVLSYRNQFIDWLCKSIDWFLYERDLRHGKINLVKVNSEDAWTIPFFSKINTPDIKMRCLEFT